MAKRHCVLVVSPEAHSKISMFAMKHGKRLQEVADKVILAALKNFEPTEDQKRKILHKLRKKERQLRKDIDSVRKIS